MSNVPKNIKRAYAVASYIGASLKAYTVDDPELHKLELQCKKAMAVFSKKVGKDGTMELANKLGDLWQELGDKHSHTIDEDSVPALIEGISMIVSPKEFKTFLGVPQYYKDRHQYYKDYPKIMDSVNSLNYKLNELLGTKSVTLQKPKVKVPKVKKPREKSKAQKRHEAEVLAEEQRVESVTKFLRDRIAKAKEMKK